MFTITQIYTWVSKLFVMAVLVAFAMPFAMLLSSLFMPIDDDFSHMMDTVFADYYRNSVGLMLGVAGLSMLFAVPAAWMVANFSFAGRKILLWIMFLPLAFPPYVVAFIYGGLFEFAGPVQEVIRQIFALSYGDYWFPSVRTLGGAVLVISLVLYPYIYMLSYVAFKKNRAAVLVAKSLGAGAFRIFWTVGMPAARPAIAAGVALVLMEALADFGAVEYLAVDTFTTGIYRSWFAFGNPVLASKLACMLLGFIIMLLMLERISRGKAGYQDMVSSAHNIPPAVLNHMHTVVTWVLCSVPVLLGFVLPLAWLGYYAAETFADVMNERFMGYAYNSLVVSGAAMVVTVFIAIIFGYILRFKPESRFLKVAIRLTTLGYAVPGSVVAVALLYGLNVIGGVVAASVVTLVFALCFRFLAIGLSSVETGMLRIRNEYVWLGRMFNLSPMQGLRKIHLPMISGNLVVAGLLVFVEAVKELPATLIIRPFNFDTLATKAYEYASDERLYDAATPALCIVMMGIVPVILLSRSLAKR